MRPNASTKMRVEPRSTVLSNIDIIPGIVMPNTFVILEIQNCIWYFGAPPAVLCHVAGSYVFSCLFSVLSYCPLAWQRSSSQCLLHSIGGDNTKKTTGLGFLKKRAFCNPVYVCVCNRENVKAGNLDEALRLLDAALDICSADDRVKAAREKLASFISSSNNWQPARCIVPVVAICLDSHLKLEFWISALVNSNRRPVACFFASVVNFKFTTETET